MIEENQVNSVSTKKMKPNPAQSHSDSRSVHSLQSPRGSQRNLNTTSQVTRDPQLFYKILKNTIFVLLVRT
jgi:hypothetical protein